MFRRFGDLRPHKISPPPAAVNGVSSAQPISAPAKPEPAASNAQALQRKLLDAKVRLHLRVIEELNLAAIEKAPYEELYKVVYELVARYVIDERLAVNIDELQKMVDELVDEMTGLGPIEPLLKDPTVSDILINTHEIVYVERFGQLEKTAVLFKDEPHLLRVVNKIVAGVGRRVDESQPMMDARLMDGSRVHVAVRPVAVDGPLVSIRKFSKRKYSLEGLAEIGSLKPQIARVLAGAVQARLSMLVSGGTGSGKTTMLNALSNHIPHNERLVTIEDAAELQLQQPHVARLETRPPNIEGHGEIRQRELVKNALRMRPDRVIIGEVRGEEAFDMLQAMNTGHEGSLTTIHANTARDALSRLEQMVGMTGFPMSQISIRATIASAIRVVIQIARQSDGARRLVNVSEITGMEGDIIQMQSIFEYVRTGIEADGKVIGEFRATGVRPKFLSQLKLLGIEPPLDTFEPGKPL